MKQATLLFLVRKDEQGLEQICLAMKKRGFGAGRYNGAGGKVEVGESVEDATKRETKEEVGVEVIAMKKCAELTFEFALKPDWNQVVHAYIATDWEGEPTESEEMKPEWFYTVDIPYASMWPDDILWLPQSLAGKYVTGNLLFGENDTILSHNFKAD